MWFNALMTVLAVGAIWIICELVAKRVVHHQQQLLLSWQQKIVEQSAVLREQAQYMERQAQSLKHWSRQLDQLVAEAAELTGKTIQEIKDEIGWTD